MLVDALFVVYYLLNTLILLLFAVSYVIVSAANILLHLKLEKDHSYLAFSILITADLF